MKISDTVSYQDILIEMNENFAKHYNLAIRSVDEYWNEVDLNDTQIFFVEGYETAWDYATQLENNHNPNSGNLTKAEIIEYKAEIKSFINKNKMFI